MPKEALEDSDPDTEIMPGIRRVIEYSGLNFYQVLDLPYDQYLLMMKNAVLTELRSTEAGRDYLKKIERLNTTDTDDEGLQNLFNY